MKALRTFAQRGSVRRVVEVDESSSDWKRKAGRDDGPDTCAWRDRV
jgi:hypothetical protein